MRGVYRQIPARIIWGKIHYRIIILFITAVHCAALHAAPGIDLVPVVIDESGAIMDCQTLEIRGGVNIELVNDGELPCGDTFTISVFEDMNGNEDYDALLDNILGFSTVTGGIPPATTINVPVTISGILQFAYNRIFVMVDSGNVILESYETNNVWDTGSQCEFIPPPSTFAPEIEWKWTGSPDMSTHNQVMAAPVVANLTDDNTDMRIDENDIPDVIFNCFTGSAYNDNGVLRAISGSDGSDIFVVSGSSYRTSPGFNIGVGDIDGDRLNEIIVGKSSTSSSIPPTMVLAFENDGTYKWTSDVISFRNTAAASIADIDEDGFSEIVIGEHVLNHDGTLKWTGSMGDSAQGISCVANLDMTGLPEIIAGHTAYRADGTVYWTVPGVDPAYSAVADFDSDPYPEVVLVAGGYVYLVEHDGGIIWGPIDLPPSGTYRDHGGPPTVADFDGDTYREIGIAGGYNYVVFDTDGSTLWSRPTSDLSSNRTGSSVFDFDGDGEAEVVYSDEYNLYIYRGTDGKELFSAVSPSGTLLELPVIVDVDNDNNAEIVMACNNYARPGDTGIHCWGDKFDNWLNTRTIWNQHAYHITNVETDGRIPRGERNNWETFNNYRLQAEDTINPFLAPDLTASAIAIDTSNCPKYVDITARIGNGGGIRIPGGMPVSFYDGDPLISPVFLGTVTTSKDLNPGEFESVTLTWYTPPSGYHDFFVAADDDGMLTSTINECDESNNVCGYTEEICINNLRTPTLSPTFTGTLVTFTPTPVSTLPVPELDCSSPVPLICGTRLAGDTSTSVNNVDYYSCSSWRENGPEKVFRLQTTTISSVYICLTDLTANLDVFLLNSCNENDCMAYGNNDIHVPALPAGIYYIVVDGYHGDSGPFTLSVTCTGITTPSIVHEFPDTKSPVFVILLLSGIMVYIVFTACLHRY